MAIDHEKKLIQVHIPKTGGLAMRFDLFNNLKPDRYMHRKPNWGGYKAYWDDYFKFTFVRNPFDKLVSAYLFSQGKLNDNRMYKELLKGHDSFNDFICNCNKDLMMSLKRFELQIKWIQNYKYDFIGRFEEIQEYYRLLCKWYLNLGDKLLPKTNITNIRQGKHYTEFYNNKTRCIVEKLYAEDLDYLNYKFGD